MESSYDALIASTRKAVLEKLAEEDWTSEVRTKTYELLTKPDSDGYKTVRVHMTMNASQKKVFDLLMDPTQLTSYDEHKESRKELASGLNYRIYLTLGKGKFMVDPRDTCVLFGFNTEPNGDIIISGSSVTHEGAPETKGRVRAQCDIMGFLLQKVAGDENKTKFSWVGKLNPKGSVPNAIVNKMIGKQGEVWEKFNSIVSKK